MERGATAAYDAADNILILWGGQPSGCGPIYDTTYVLTYANGLGGTGQWTQLSPSNTITNNFENGPGGYDPHTTFFIGVGVDNGSYDDTARLLSGAVPVPSSPAWTDLIPDWSAPQYSASPGAGIYDPTMNALLTCCGYDATLPSGQQLTSETWVLNSANGQVGTATWTEVDPSGPLPPARSANTLVYNAASNRMIIFGGIDQSNNPFGDVWVLVSPLASSTSTALSSSADPSDVGDTITFTASVTSSSGTPTGSVAFFDGATSLATVPLSSGAASFTTSSLAAGSHNISAQYTPNSPGITASSGALTQTVISLTDVALLSGNNLFNGNQTVTGTVTAGSFVGNLTGNATSATTAFGLNCSGCVTATQLGVNWALGDSPGGNATTADNALALGGFPASAFAPASGSLNYLGTSGGTLTGALNLPANGLTVGQTQLAVTAASINTGLPLAIQPNADVPQLNLIQSNYSQGGWTLRAGVDGDLHLVRYQANAWECLNPLGTACERVTFQNLSGNVGIGTTSPQALLDVNGTANFSGLVSFASGQTFPGAGTITGVTAGTGLAGGGTTGTLSLAIDPTVVASQANLANGVTTAENFATSAATAAQTNAVNAAAAFANNTFLPLAGGTLTGPLNLPANGLVAGSNQFVLSGGSVGVGTSTPGQVGSYNLTTNCSPTGCQPVGGTLIHIKGANASSPNARLTVEGNLPWTDWINDAGNPNDRWLLFFNHDGIGDFWSLLDNASPLTQHILTMNLATGNVGMGTATPQATLEVNGTAQFDSTVTFASGQIFPGAGTVTSVGAGAGLTGGPITGSGTLSIAPAGVTNAMLASSYSGVGACGSKTWVVALNANAPPLCTQPAAANLSNGTTGNGSVVLATAPTLTAATFSATSNQLTVGTTHTDTVSFAAPAASRTLTVPDPGANANFAFGAIANCGASTSCTSPLTVTSPIILTVGHVAMAAKTTVAITGFPHAYSATTTFACTATDPTHPAYKWTVTNDSTTGITIRAETSNSDTWTYSCFGY
jgi:hypothetical protein